MNKDDAADWILYAGYAMAVLALIAWPIWHSWFAVLGCTILALLFWGVGVRRTFGRKR